MPSDHWLKNAFSYGFSSGDLSTETADDRTRNQEAKCGGSYQEMIEKGIKPYVEKNSKILELGPGAGSWTRVLLGLVPEGEVHTVDFVDVTQFINPSEWGGRLHCHRITEINYSSLQDDYFDLFFSFGVLCHNPEASRFNILCEALPKVKRGGYSLHEYADWRKLGAFGWRKGGVPTYFRLLPDSMIWWPRNNRDMMVDTAKRAGWNVVVPDLNLFQRDGVIALSRP